MHLEGQLPMELDKLRRIVLESQDMSSMIQQTME